MRKTLLPILFATTAIYASEADPMADACRRLSAALEQELAALQEMTAPDNASASLDALRKSLLEMEDLFSAGEKALWIYIDNTEGVKQPLVDLLEEIAVQFARVQAAGYFGNEELRALLAPQIELDESAKHAKREKVHSIDHDE